LRWLTKLPLKSTAREDHLLGLFLYMDKGIRLWTYAQPDQTIDKNPSISL
jgi:hypothetical protein